MRILIVKTSALGDIVQTLPLLEYLKNRFPDALIDWVVEERCASLLKGHPMIHHLIEINSKKWQYKNLRQVTYDLVFDPQANTKSALILFLVKSKLKIGFGIKNVREWTNLFFTHKRFNLPLGQNIREDNLSLAKLYFKDDSPYIPHQARPMTQWQTIMVCPGSRWPNKQLSAQTLQDFLTCIDQKFAPHFLFVWGTEQEKALVSTLKVGSSQIVDKLSLLELRALMEQVDLVISMDSLPLHLAGSTTTPTFAIFGPSSKKKFAPGMAVQGACPYKRTFEKRCPILRTCPTGACMHQFTGKELFNELWLQVGQCYD